MTEQRANEIFGGTFLIGLAVLFLLGWWWPGIMYVIGIALLVRSNVLGRSWTEERAGLIALAIGVIFTVIDLLRIFTFAWWPLILILLGLYLLFGSRWRPRGDKSKNDLV